MNRKLVVYLPPDALSVVREALFAAGAGQLGAYDRCCWYAHGMGTFRPLEGADPAVGEVGREEHIAEYRLETMFPEEIQDEVVAALRRAHPYEQPAYDIFPLL